MPGGAAACAVLDAPAVSRLLDGADAGCDRQRRCDLGRQAGRHRLSATGAAHQRRGGGQSQRRRLSPRLRQRWSKRGGAGCPARRWDAPLSGCATARLHSGRHGALLLGALSDRRRLPGDRQLDVSAAGRFPARARLLVLLLQPGARLHSALRSLDDSRRYSVVDGRHRHERRRSHQPGAALSRGSAGGAAPAVAARAPLCCVAGAGRVGRRRAA